MARKVGLVLLVSLGIALPALAQSEPSSGEWTFAVQPYLWLIGVDGTLKYEIPSSGEGGADVGLSLEDLHFAFMMSAEARTGNWSLFTDVAYADIRTHDTVEAVRFSGSDGPVAVDVAPDSETSTSITATEWTLAAGRTLIRGPSSALEVLGGVRYLSVEARSEWRLAGEVTGPGAGQSFDRQGSASESVDLWDGIVGIRGELALGSRWFVPYYGDIGTGTSDLTWQAIAGVGYRFKVWDLRLAYRYLHYDMNDEKLLQSVSFSGGGISAKFRF
jgi:hypothetical protein